MTLKIEDLTGGYTQIPVIKNINFEIEKGEVLGLIGLNGAGKSTIVKHIIGLLKPFSGDIILNDFSILDKPENYLNQIAYVPETPILYRELTLKEHLQLTGRAYGMKDQVVEERAKSLLERFRLENHLDWFPHDFSKGMKQKVMLSCALLVKPAVLIIDEPFIGLDPLAIFELEKMLKDLVDAGHSVLLTTHVLANAEKLCDSFVFLDDGEIISQGTFSQMRDDLDLDVKNLEELYLHIALNEAKK